MADERALQDNQSNVGSLLERFRAALVPDPIHQDYQKSMDLLKMDPAAFVAHLKQPPTSTGIAGSLANVMPIAGITKAELKAGVRPPVQIATIARKGEIPTVAPHEMWPAGINPETGQVGHAYKPGIGGHDPVMKAMGEGAVRGFVDPNTWKAYTQEALEALGNYWERAGGFFRAR